MKKLITICLVVLFATNAYGNFVVYDTAGSQSRIQQAMDALGYAGQYVVRGPGNAVTAADLAAADALIVGWNFDIIDMSGLPAAVLESGITGNILLTGHDADYHASYGHAAATTFLGQAIDFSTEKGGTGLVALSDWGSSPAFDYLPASWGITATGGLTAELIIEITSEGYATGVYDGLTAGDMSNWGQSYHTRFDGWDASMFELYEIGLDGGEEMNITIGRVIPAPGAILLGGIGVALVGWLRRRRTL